VTDLSQLNEQTIIVDCDVIQADGGTRTTAITGGFVALYDAVQKMSVQGLFKTFPISNFVAAVSCGIVDGRVLLDLNYEEDSNASSDLNIVMTDEDRVVEIQGTAEGDTFTMEQMDEMVNLARRGLKDLVDAQRKCLSIELV
jgi:ribonuclease PH